MIHGSNGNADNFGNSNSGIIGNGNAQATSSNAGEMFNSATNVNISGGYFTVSQGNHVPVNVTIIINGIPRTTGSDVQVLIQNDSEPSAQNVAPSPNPSLRRRRPNRDEANVIRPVPSQRSDEMYERHLTLNGERLNLSESQTHPEYVSTSSVRDQEQTVSSSREKGNQLEIQIHPEYGVVIGIDLGTTYSCVGVYRGRVEIIPNDQGNRMTASWVGFHGNEQLIGDSAKDSFHLNPKNTIFDVKRLIGRTIEEVKRHLKHLPFMVESRNDAPMISVKYKDEIREFTPEQISAMILGRMKATAEAYLGHEVTHAVVTVPSHFNNAQRQATKNAGEIAGLKVLRVLDDSVAAALACARGSESKIIVYDLGGGTFDVSLHSVDNGVSTVLATAEDTHLGGEDFDNRVLDYLVEGYNEKTGSDVSSNQCAMSKLKKAVELAKRKLSLQLSAMIEIENFENGHGFLETLTRGQFEALNLELFERTMKRVEQVLKDAKVMKSEIDEVILVGGSTRIPKVQELLKDYFGKEPSRDINPDEALVVGATIQAGVLSGQINFNVLNVSSRTLGIELNGGAFIPIIKRNIVIPTKISKIFSTSFDNQSSVKIKVFEGDGEKTEFNHLLGEFKLVGILPAPKGVPLVEITFELDADSILKIKALNKETGESELLIKGLARKSEMFVAKDLLHEPEEVEKQRDRNVPRMPVRTSEYWIILCFFFFFCFFCLFCLFEKLVIP